MSAGAPPREVSAAGGVVYRRSRAGIEVVLVARPAEGLWALPKGKPNDGETIEQTALREVAEETGLEVAIDLDAGGSGKIGSIDYSYEDGDPRQGGPLQVRKVVHHFLMRARGGDTARHDREHDLVAWYEIDEAARRMTYPNERAIVERAGAVLGGKEASP